MVLCYFKLLSKEYACMHHNIISASLVLGLPQKNDFKIFPYFNPGLVSSRGSLTSWGEGASLALVGHPSSDGVTIKMPYGVDVLHRSVSHSIFSYWVG